MSPLDRKIVIEKLYEGRKLANDLKIVLDRPSEKDGHPMANDLVVKILSSFMDLISIMNQSPKEYFPDMYGRKEDSGDNSNSSVSRNRRGCYKRRKTSHTSTKIVPNLIDDGHAWRKYGQKVILNAKHPRNYFRCTHKFDQDCQATKQVQKTDDEPSMYQITYHGIHTCTNPLLKNPHIIFEATPFDESKFLFSFNSINKSHDDSRFPNFPSVKQDYSPTMDQNKSPPHGCHMSSDMTAIGSSAPISVFSPGSDQGDVLSYLSSTSTPNNGFDHMDMMESIHGFCDNLELEFENCYT